jgi:hypothetical protein
MDPAEKQARHGRDLQAAIRSRSTLPLIRIFGDSEYPAAWQRATFYAQSHSLVEFLTELDSPTEFLRFVTLSTELGSDRALVEVYGIGSDELERRWQQHAARLQLVSAKTR